MIFSYFTFSLIDYLFCHCSIFFLVFIYRNLLFHVCFSYLTCSSIDLSSHLQASQPETPSRSPDSNELDDADSVKSFGSVSSAVSCDAALTHHHRGQACGGTANASKGGRSFKYVLHCRHNHDHDPEQYLTPTQRAARRIRELKVNFKVHILFLFFHLDDVTKRVIRGVSSVDNVKIEVKE
ncbi:hypothetical protein E2C01_073220 [Portunus trituberculatus]|uniref:Uncharacterized protein n=1 Tax=Portunus trituberculatus TaxID=210409 RepID=A0A5B7I4L6_PORTR|nr:hypothetical protein [Portunus trituberculatus]